MFGKTVGRSASSIIRPAAIVRVVRPLGAAIALGLACLPLMTQAQVVDPNNQNGQGGQGSQNSSGNSSSSSSSATNAAPSYGTFQGVSIGSGGAGDSVLPSAANSDGTTGTNANTTGKTSLDKLQASVGDTIKPPAEPGEFEKYVEQVVGRKIPRFGANLMINPERDFAVPAQATVPPDYALNVGDTVSVSLTGSVEGSADFTIDNNGQIYIPKVGEVTLIGVRYRDLKDRIAARIGQQYRGYQVSVSIKKLRGIRVYVTGFANSPGAFSVNSLSTLVNAVMAAGGPTAGGSYRSIQLLRNGHLVTDFDLYDLLLRGDRSHDTVLQNEDVIFITPVGRQLVIVGSVNQEGIYEAKPGETISEMLGYAGGTNALGDKSRAIVYSLSDKEQLGSREISAELAHSTQVAGGDIIQILSKGSLVQPIERQQVLVRVEGEVNKPGNYYVEPNSPLKAVIELAGGLSPRAYPYGTRLKRLSIMEQQRAALRQALDQFEIELDTAPLSPGQFAAADEASQHAAARAVIARLRKSEGDGRLVLPIAYEDRTLPADLVLENNDQIVVPPLLQTAGVYGAVYRPATFLYEPARHERVKDLIERAGGPEASADKGHIFVVRASGEVLTRKRGAMDAYLRPGDLVFVPVKIHSSSLLSKLAAISQMVLSVGLTAAVIRTLP